MKKTYGDIIKSDYRVTDIDIIEWSDTFMSIFEITYIKPHILNRLKYNIDNASI